MSVGSNNEWSFEESIYERLPHCSIHTFDCKCKFKGIRFRFRLRGSRGYQEPHKVVTHEEKDFLKPFKILVTGKRFSDHHSLCLYRFYEVCLGDTDTRIDMNHFLSRPSLLALANIS